MKAVVIRSAMRVFDCLVESTGERVSATALGNLLKGEGGGIVVGDHVEINGGVIEKIFERQNTLFRYQVREQKAKIIASNIDLLAVVAPLANPDYKWGLVDRLLIRSEQWGIPAIVIYTKADLPHQVQLDFERGRLSGVVVDTFEVSAKNTEKYEFERLVNFLQGKKVFFTGQSGVGKSTLINALATYSGESVELTVGELAHSGKGGHTTTWVELIPLKHFMPLDSPGMRSLSLDDISREELPDFFPDLSPFYAQCKYTNCEHYPSDLGCYFNSLDSSLLKNKYLLSRLESLHRMMSDLRG